MAISPLCSSCFYVPESFRRRGTCLVGALQSILAFMVMILTAAYSQHPEELIEISDGTLSLETVKALSGILITISIASAIMVALSILIIFGAQTQRPLLLLPWIGYYMVVLVIYMLGICAQVVSLTMMNAFPVAIITLLGGLITLYIGTYMILIVYRHYSDLKKLNF